MDGLGWGGVARDVIGRDSIRWMGRVGWSVGGPESASLVQLPLGTGIANSTAPPAPGGTPPREHDHPASFAETATATRNSTVLGMAPLPLRLGIVPYLAWHHCHCD